MEVAEINVARKYRMTDDRVLRVSRIWDAPSGHRRVGFEVVKGDHSGFKDMSLKEFAAQAVQEV
ncbi:hypothetical protein [Acidiphilium sp.]|uniref:hypothetical protein n=1 Tax=Acidiphilium sp. TaxID=527 RepID=UPI002587DA24|nr:hypothetical protein [Acidiphilium sp.]